MAVLVGCTPHQWGWSGCWEGKGRAGGPGLESTGCDSSVLVHAQHVWPSPETSEVKPNLKGRDPPPPPPPPSPALCAIYNL